MPSSLTVSELAATIDHTLLRADVTDAMLAGHCREAAEKGFASVAVSTASVKRCASVLSGTDVAVCAAVGFPYGQTPTQVKVFEAQQAISDGAGEIDFVINIGALKSGRLEDVAQELELVVDACEDKVSKVILETCYLSDEEKQQACLMAIDAGATYVKTSTGTGPSGATLPDVYLLRSLSHDRIQVKAAGGIRTLEQALAFLDAGCERIGTSSGLAIIAEAGDVLNQ